MFTDLGNREPGGGGGLLSGAAATLRRSPDSLGTLKTINAEKSQAFFFLKVPSLDTHKREITLR